MTTSDDVVTDNLRRTISDISLETTNEHVRKPPLPPIPELVVAAAKCECCGMCEECTLEYVTGVRERFAGKVVCGLCGEAVKEEMEKNGGKREEAVEEHMRECLRFNKVDRAFPVLYQGEVMREILRKWSTKKGKSPNPRGGPVGTGGIPRSSSCIPAISGHVGDRTLVK